MTGICHPVGTRLPQDGGVYCYDNGSFLPQKALGAACSNDYECRNNKCISGACAEPEEKKGFLERLLEWLESLY